MDEWMNKGMSELRASDHVTDMARIMSCLTGFPVENYHGAHGIRLYIYSVSEVIFEVEGIRKHSTEW